MPAMTSETNIFSFGEIADPVEKARAALRAVRQYQQDWQELGTDRVYKYFDDVEGDWLENFDSIEVECIHYGFKTMTSISVDLNALNEFNQLTAGKICFVKTSDETLLPIYSVEEFKPDQHFLVLDQIWTFDQEQVVRKLLDHLSTSTGGIETLGEIIMWQKVLIEWLDQNLSNSYIDGVLND